MGIEGSMAAYSQLSWMRGTEGAKQTSCRRTSRLLRLLEQPLLKCALLLQRRELLGFAIRVTFWMVVLGEYAMPVGVDDEECSDCVQRQVHRNARSREYQARLLIAFWEQKKEKAATTVEGEVVEVVVTVESVSGFSALDRSLPSRPRRREQRLLPRAYIHVYTFLLAAA